MNSLLSDAGRLIESEVSPKSDVLRMSCWFSRGALEDVVRRLLLLKGVEAGEATMRSQLACLEVAYRTDRPSLAATAEYAWSGLSRACHYHAFELTPTLSEVRHLWSLVRDLYMIAEGE